MTTSSPTTPPRRFSSSSELLCPPPLKRSRVDYESDTTEDSSNEFPAFLLMPLDFEDNEVADQNIPPPRFLQPRTKSRVIMPFPLKRRPLPMADVVGDLPSLGSKLDDVSAPPMKRSRSSISMCASEKLPRFTDNSPVARCA